MGHKTYNTAVILAQLKDNLETIDGLFYKAEEYIMESTPGGTQDCLIKLAEEIFKIGERQVRFLNEEQCLFILYSNSLRFLKNKNNLLKSRLPYGLLLETLLISRLGSLLEGEIISILRRKGPKDEKKLKNYAYAARKYLFHMEKLDFFDEDCINENICIFESEILTYGLIPFGKNFDFVVYLFEEAFENISLQWQCEIIMFNGFEIHFYKYQQ